MHRLGSSGACAEERDGSEAGSKVEDGAKSVLAGTETVAGSETPLNGGLMSNETPSVCGAELQACLTVEEEKLSFWRGLLVFIVRGGVRWVEARKNDSFHMYVVHCIVPDVPCSLASAGAWLFGVE